MTEEELKPIDTGKYKITETGQVLKITMEEKYKEILRLKCMLEKAKIPFEFSELFGGYHIVYPNNQFTECSVIEHDCSYGREKDLLEIRGLMTNKEINRERDNVLGYLSAKEVFKRIKNNWKKLRRCLDD